MHDPRFEDAQPLGENAVEPDVGLDADPQIAGTQLVLESLPGMAELDALHLDLDEIDRVLADLDNQRPDRRESGQDTRPAI